MPVVTVDWWKGNDRARRAELVSEVTSTLSRIAGCPEEAVTVLIRDVEQGHWGKGGVLADTTVDQTDSDSQPSVSAGTSTRAGNEPEHSRDVSRL
jgi:4-oxalocrotonate tautomerase